MRAVRATSCTSACRSRAGRIRRWWCRSHPLRPRGRRRGRGGAGPARVDPVARPARAGVPVGGRAAGPARHRAPSGGRSHRGGTAGHLHAGGRAGALVQPRGVSRPGPDVGGTGGRAAARTAVGRHRGRPYDAQSRRTRRARRAAGRCRRRAGGRAGHAGGYGRGGRRPLPYVRDGARTAVGPALDFGRLSDDHGSRLRCTGAMAGIHARDLVEAAFTADFTGFRLTCTPG